jgi:SAM-dependent methyltransferase
VPAPPPAPERFRHLDRYRVDREWNRYEGTAQRELFRTLRERFLARHVVDGGVALDIGSGSGRFTPRLGGPSNRRIAVDLSAEMLRAIPQHWPSDRDPPDRVLADGRSPPFRSRSASQVGLLGNAVGFAGDDALRILHRSADLLAPGGRLLVETAPGPGTSSRYLHRLPPGAVQRLLHAPLGAVAPRILKEGFVRLDSPDRTRHGFRPLGYRTLAGALAEDGLEVAESMAVAPSLGAEPDVVEAVRADPVAWERLLALEERIGASPRVRDAAAALLVAAVRPAAGDAAEGRK